ncbi:ankyrin repeat domain-containing protein [Paenibacillus sp. FSL P4-0184]|uniref:ankyrin repeat domain-containing protein n=1 Tax=Paenibacillus sp. FSL P4-0184 TaxID=2921632 RepID=UPI0030FA965A
MFRDLLLTARLLIGYKCDVNHKTNEEETALMFAVENSNLEMITMLIVNGADLLARNKKGQTALDIAKSMEQTYAIKKIIEYLSGHL